MTTPTGPTTPTTPTTPQCSATQTVCNAACVDLKTDGANCGVCGTACGTGTVCSSGSCVSTCESGTTQCGTSCVDLKAAQNNCGTCGTVCATGTSCTAGSCACNAPTTQCGGSCVDMSQDNQNCGSCGNVCSGPLTCSSGACSLSTYGTGSDGNQMVTTDTTINTASSPIVGTAGAMTITLTIPDSFQAGQTVLLHQTQGTGAGVWELAAIKSVANGTAVLGAKLANTYTTGGGSAAQAVLVHQYDTVDVAAGATLNAPAWNGATGGILVFEAKTAVTVEGAISMNGRGFRGFTHAATCLPALCGANAINGFYGESALGPAMMSTQSNDGHGTAGGSGGGGGTIGQDCSSGGGGAYDTGATAGGDGNLGACVVNGMHGGGQAGAAIGDPDLTKALLFGGAGGEGGPDEDGAYPGAGGNGGGSILIFSPTVTVTGPITANATNGTDGVTNSPACGGAGCGMGGGGGGAGGSIRIVAPNATLGASLVSAVGGTGGSCTCGGFSPGGVGSSGRIQVKASNAIGTTMPAFQP